MMLICIVDLSGVGKTSLLLRFADDEFHGDLFPWGCIIQEKHKIIEVYDQKIKLRVWNMTRKYDHRYRLHQYHRAQGFIIMCDVTDKTSFGYDKLNKIIRDIEQNAKENVPILIIGNKVDKIEYESSEMLMYGYFRQCVIKEHGLRFPTDLVSICIEYYPTINKRISKGTQLSYDDAKSHAKRYGIKYMEISCKTGENVSNVFHDLTVDIFKHNKWTHSTNASSDTNSKSKHCVVL